MAISPYRTLLAHAVVLSGGRASFAELIGVDHVALHEWLIGACDVPEAIFDKALDIILREDAPYLRKGSAPT